MTDFELKPHNKDLYFTSQIATPFDKEARCNRFMGFLDEVIIDEEGKPDKEVQRLLQEFAGYALTPEVNHEKALLLLGDGANGKSVWLRVIEELVGMRNVSSIPLEALDDQFRVAELQGKLINVGSEITARGRNAINTDRLKQLVSGELIQASRKYKTPFEFHPSAKFIFAANDLPRVYDTSHGFWRRMLVVKFRRKFEEEDQDKALLGKLMKELPGILNWSLAGLAFLREEGRFISPESVAAETEVFRLQSNPIAEFVEEMCEIGVDHWTSTNDLYTSYGVWADKNGLNKTPKTWFGRYLGRFENGVSKGRRNEKGWEGIRLR